MTTQQLHLFNCVYLVVLVVVAFLTRATARRIAGALAGGFASGVVALATIALGEEMRWWHLAISWEVYAITLLLIDFALSAFIYLITWRIARRFGYRGLVAVVLIAAIVGPPRDYWILAQYPEWGAYRPGITPIAVISATYAMMVALGHTVMRLIAGPDQASRMATWPWETVDAHPLGSDQNHRR